MSALLCERLEGAAEKQARAGNHVRQLMATLVNPSEWEFTGEVIDAGSPCAFCACGHEIRFCFQLSHPTRGVNHVGSTCINHIAQISPELGAKLQAADDDLQKRLAEAKAKAKRALADAENTRLWAVYEQARDAARAAHEANRRSGVMSPRDLWYFCEGYKEKYRAWSPPEYTKAGPLKKWLVAAIARATEVLA